MIEDFGKTADGETVRRLTIKGGGLTAHVLTYGAVIQDLRLERHAPPLVLGFERLEDYIDHSPYFGATVGRYANRIANGRLSIDGEEIQLDRNENGHHLHGGSRGIGTRVWDIEAYSSDSVTLAIDCADGEMGYPGNARIRTIYALRSGGVLSVRHETTTDKPAPANVTHHSYFNLDGRETILDHELMLAADYYLPTDQDQIPTGAVEDVEGTVFDFRDMRPIRCEKACAQVEYDHNFCLSEERVAKRSVALVRSLDSGVTLEVRTSEPGLQFYAGHKLVMPVPGLEDRRYGRFSGFCLEAQNWPDAPNHSAFPPALLRSGETLVQETDYVFARS
jgi:aldose 1-epimerase